MRIPRIHRSLIGQTALLSLTLLALAITLVVLLPTLKRHRTDPQQYTLTLAMEALWQLARRDASAGMQERPLNAILEHEDIRKVMAANSNLRLYIRRGPETFQVGAPPRWEQALRDSLRNPLDYSHSWAEEGMAANIHIGTNHKAASLEFNEGSAIGRSVYLLFGDEQDAYYEVGGIEVPVGVNKYAEMLGDPASIWRWSRNYLVTGFAVLVGILALLSLLAHSLRRVARVARSIDPQAPDHGSLPEKGLPTEILPMVRAINQMVRRIDQTNEEQAFFLAAAAHELRTPLTVVRTRLENLPDGEDKEQLKRDLRRMTRLVDQLLRLISMRNKPAPSGAVDLVSIAKNVVTARAPLVIDKDVQIDLEAASAPWQVPGDARLLEIALGNLVDNALSFSKSGQRLQVKVSQPERNITVCDQGPGVPAAEMESIFQPFAKNPPNRKGHGLGLAITRAIMALHGGSVNAANLKGGGARFALQF